MLYNLLHWVRSTRSSRNLQETRWTSFKGSLHPALRANPFPEVTDLICRLPLSTLVYRPEAMNLGDLMRIWVRPERANKPHLGFSRIEHSAPDTSETEMLCQQLTPLSSQSDSRGKQLLKRKENATRDHARYLRVQLCCHTISTIWFGNINPIPFRSAEQCTSSDAITLSP